MGLLLILPILVSGYLVCMSHPYYFSRLHRYDGQLLYLRVAKLGLTCILVALTLSALISHFVPDAWQAFGNIVQVALQGLGVNTVEVAPYRLLLQLTCMSVLIPIPWIIFGRMTGYLKGRYIGVASARSRERRTIIG